MDRIIQELQDPLTLELLEDPITVPCCTKAFSRRPLAEYLQSHRQQQQQEDDDNEQHDPVVCPNCRRSLQDFDAQTAPRNVVLASMVDQIRGAATSTPSNTTNGTSNKDDGQHQWSCTLTPLLESDPRTAEDNDQVAELVLSCQESKFDTRPSLFIAVVDESGSMSGRPMEQVKTALNHMVGLAATTSQVQLRMISYSSLAHEIDHPSEYGQNIGGTNFVAAFCQIALLLQKYKCSDAPEEAHQLNNVSSVTIAFLTDGQDGSRLPKSRLVPDLQERLEKAGWPTSSSSNEPGSNNTAPPLTVHAIGFGHGCDRDLLESMRLVGNQEGMFRYADPQDDGDTLCNKLTDLFELSSRASSVPVTIQVGGDDENNDPQKEIRFAVDSQRHGEYREWIHVNNTRPVTKVLVNSALDNNVSVPIQTKPCNKTVFQRWLSKCADELAARILSLMRGDDEMNFPGKARQLYCAVLKCQVESIARNVAKDNLELQGRVEFLKSQTLAAAAGTQVQLGKLSDLRFASAFAGSSSNNKTARPATKLVNIRTLPPQETPQIDIEPAFERPLQKRYSRNNKYAGRNALQEAIVSTVVDTVTDQVKGLIDSSSLEDILATDNDGNNAIMLAAYCGHSAILAAMLKQHPGLDLELRNPDYETAVTLAIKKRGFHHTLCTLLDAGAAIPRRKALERFCVEHGFDITAQIIANHGETNFDVDEFMTPEYVKFVYERAAKSEDTSWKNERFLSVALSKQLKTVAKKLMDAGVQPTIDMLVKHCIPPKPDHPETDKYLDLTKLLIERRPELLFEKTQTEQETALFAASSGGSEPHVQYFIRLLKERTNNQADFLSHLEAMNEKGNTALWVASFQRYPCIMDILMDHGANVNQENEKGNCPLYGPCCRGPPKVAEQLIRRGAKVDAILKTGETNILICCRNGTADVLKLLLQYTDEDFVNHKAPIDGFNAIMAAAEQDRTECIRVLHEYGIDLDQCTDDDNAILSRATPLHIAAYYGRVEAAKVLLELGANPNVQDVHGSTPMHLAVIQGQTDMIEVLRDYADLQVQDNAGYSPVAYCRNNKEIEKLLVNPLVAPLVEFAKGAYSADEEAAALKILATSRIPAVMEPSQVFNPCDLGGTSILSYAVINMKKDLVQAMVDLGVELGCDDDGTHILTWATWSRNRRIHLLLEKKAQPNQDSERQIGNLTKEMVDPISEQLLFPSQPPAYEPDLPSSILKRMQVFVNAPFPSEMLNEPFAQGLPMLMPTEKQVDKHFEDSDLEELKKTRLFWDAKVATVRNIAHGNCLDASELFAMSMYTNNAVTAEVVGSQLIQRRFSSSAIKDYISVLHRGLSKLSPYEGEVFLASADIDRKLFVKGREFTWNRFVSASTLWRVALENLPSFTSKARKGVIFLIKSKTGRAVLRSFNAEVIFLPNTRFLVTNWYHGDVIALGQENIREHTFGIEDEKDGSNTHRLNLKEMTESDKSLIIELKEITSN